MSYRIVLPIALFGLGSGCAEQADSTLVHQARLQQQTKGLALHQTGDLDPRNDPKRNEFSFPPECLSAW